MLPERSTINTTSGAVLPGKLNLGTRVIISTVHFKKRLAHLMSRMKSLPHSVDGWTSFASARCGLKGSSGVFSECPPRITEIGCDGDCSGCSMRC